MAKVPGKEPEPQQNPQSGDQSQQNGQPQQERFTPQKFALLISDRQRFRRILPGTSRAQRAHLDSSAHIGEQREGLRKLIAGIEEADRMYPGVIDPDGIQLAIVDEDAKTEHVMGLGEAMDTRDALDRMAWHRLSTHKKSNNPHVRKRAMHVLGFGIIDDKPADDKVKEKYKDQDKLLDNY